MYVVCDYNRNKKSSDYDFTRKINVKQYLLYHFCTNDKNE